MLVTVNHILVYSIPYLNTVGPTVALPFWMYVLTTNSKCF